MMKSLVTTLFALSLAACANYGNFDLERTSEPVPSTGRVLPQTKAMPAISLLGKAEASKTETNKRITSSLMECVSDGCKTQCARGVDNQSRPKWCMYFKEPADRHAASDASGAAN